MTRVNHHSYSDEILSEEQACFKSSRSLISAESCSKWCPESPRRPPEYLEAWKRTNDEDLTIMKSESFAAEKETKKTDRLGAKMVVYKKSPSKHLHVNLGFPSCDHGLHVDPYPKIPHPDKWKLNRKQNVWVQGITTDFPEIPKQLPRLNATETKLSEPIIIHNALFKGVAIIRIRGLNTDDDFYFNGKRRKHQLIIQGSFKARYRADEIWGGQIFRHAWTNMPSAWMIRAGMSTVKMVNPSISERLTSNKNPFVLFPWISMPQKVSITATGDTPPDICSANGINEDCTLLGPQFKNQDASHRRRYFTDYSKLKNVYFEKDFVYTFEDYQDALDFNTFSFNLKFGSLDIALRLHDMPLEMGVMKFKPSDLKKKQVEDEFENLESVPYFWRFQLWPKSCVINRYYRGDSNNDASLSKMGRSLSFKKGKGKK